MSKQHAQTTSTPWRLGGCSGRMIESKGHLGFIADVDLKANAELIIKAVNNHEKLVEALTNMVAYMEEFCDVPDSDMTFNESKQLLTELKS